MSYLVFDTGGLWWGLGLDAVQEVLHLPELIRPAGRPPFLEGFLAMGTDCFSVIHMARLLALTEEPAGLYTPVVLLRSARLALLVTTLVGVVSPEAVRELPSETVLNDCVAGGFEHENRTVQVLSVERLLLEEESRRVEELRRAHIERLERLEAS